MNWKKALLLIFLSFLLPLLDISFFASFSFGGATIVSTYIMIIVFSLLLDSKNMSNELVLFEAASLIIFSVFSSVPVWLLSLCFFFVPGIIYYLRKNYFRTPSFFILVLLFLISNFIFEFLLLAYFGEIGKTGFQVLGSYVLINSIIGYSIYRILDNYRSKRVEIKL